MSQVAGGKLYAHRPAAKTTQNSLNTLYEVVRSQEPHDGRALTAQQVQEICNVIGRQPHPRALVSLTRTCNETFISCDLQKI